MSRPDQVEVHKTLGRIGSELGFPLQILNGCGHRNLTRQLRRMRTALLRWFDMLVPIVGSYRLIVDFDKQVGGGLRSSVRSDIERKGDVSEEAVGLRDRKMRQVAGPGWRGMKDRLGGPFRHRERVCFHANSRRPAACCRSTAVVICRAKIALTLTRLSSRQPATEERNYETTPRSVLVAKLVRVRLIFSARVRKRQAL